MSDKIRKGEKLVTIWNLVAIRPTELSIYPHRKLPRKERCEWNAVQRTNFSKKKPLPPMPPRLVPFGLDVWPSCAKIRLAESRTITAATLLAGDDWWSVIPSRRRFPTVPREKQKRLNDEAPLISSRPAKRTWPAPGQHDEHDLSCDTDKTVKQQEGIPSC